MVKSFLIHIRFDKVHCPEETDYPNISLQIMHPLLSARKVSELGSGAGS